MKENKKKKLVQQSWEPHPVLGTLLKIWKVLYSAIKVAGAAVLTVIVICGICALVFMGTLGDYLQNDIIPMASIDLDNFSLDLNSFVYNVNSNGEIELLQRIHSTNSREWVEYEDIPENLIHATVAIEDKRFYEHQGVDWVTTIKACARMFFGDGSKGGSTITQQFIKNFTGENSVTVQRKVLEIFRATEFEKRYDKEVVLEWYLNTIYMGQRRNGVKMAAEIYFGKELEKLTIAECASLISITNNPSLYNPYRTSVDNGGLDGAQRNRVRMINTLDQMLEQGWITQEEYDEAIAQEIVFKWGIADEDRIASCTAEGCDYRDTVSTFTKTDEGYICPKCGAKNDIDGSASQEVYSYFVDTVIEDVATALAEKDGVEMNAETMKAYKKMIGTAGYHIFTTYNEDVQAQVDRIYKDLSQIPKTRSGQQLQSAIVIIDNSTGDIVAMAGGVGNDKVHDGLNRAVDSDLQTGSAIKPISIYAPAFEAGMINPATVIKDLPLNYDTGTGWPKNDNRKYSYSRTIHSAVVSSVNAVAANTLDAIGTTYSYKFAKEKFGLSGLTDKYIAPSGKEMNDIGYAPLAMGAQTIGITVKDMASAFATFANKGTYREGRTWTKVYDSDGNLVLDNTQDSREILSQKTINYMNSCLVAAVNGGTGYEARISGQNVYGKTGTTSSSKDRWFCGFTGYYTAAIWCGYDQPEVISMSSGQGNNPSAVLFKKVMQPLHNGLKKVNLVDSGKLRTISVCLDSGKLATEACKNDVRAVVRTDSAGVYAEDVPKSSCDRHVVVDWCVEGGAVCTEYCKRFAEANQSTVESKALVKLTQQEVDAIKKAATCGLTEDFVRDDYIYLVSKIGNDGKDVPFKGLNNDKNLGMEAPYIVCTAHTEKTWTEYENANNAQQPEEGGNENAGNTGNGDNTGNAGDTGNAGNTDNAGNTGNAGDTGNANSSNNPNG